MTEKKPTIKDVLDAVEALTKRVVDLEKPQTEEVGVPPVSDGGTNYVPTAFTVAQKTPLVQTQTSSGFPIPLDYREIVNSVLNWKFSIDMGYHGDSASFDFSILVPQEYSNATPAHWETYKEDRRTRVVDNALGLNGVREWAQRVYNNLPPETQAKVVFDRAQV